MLQPRRTNALPRRVRRALDDLEQRLGLRLSLVQLARYLAWLHPATFRSPPIDPRGPAATTSREQRLQLLVARQSRGVALFHPKDQLAGMPLPKRRQARPILMQGLALIAGKGCCRRCARQG